MIHRSTRRVYIIDRANSRDITGKKKTSSVTKRRTSYFKSKKTKASNLEALVGGNPELLHTVPRKQQTTKVCLSAARADFNVIADIKSPYIKTRVSNLVMGRGITMEQHARSVRIKKYQDDLDAVRRDGEHLIDVPVEEHTEELCLTAVLNAPKAYYFIRSPLIREFCDNALRGSSLTPESFENAKIRRVGFFRGMQCGPK